MLVVFEKAYGQSCLIEFCRFQEQEGIASAALF